MERRKKAALRSLRRIYFAINRQFPEHLAQCRAFLRQKSVSATGEGIRETAEMVGSFIEDLGGAVTLWGNSLSGLMFMRCRVDR